MSVLCGNLIQNSGDIYMENRLISENKCSSALLGFPLKHLRCLKK